MSAVPTTKAPAPVKKAGGEEKKKNMKKVRLGPKRAEITVKSNRAHKPRAYAKKVPETHLFRRKLMLAHRHHKLKQKENHKKRDNLRNELAFTRAERYMREYIDQETTLKNAQFEAKARGSVWVPAEPRLAFVIRIRGILGISPKPRKILQLFRLRQINNGVFVRLNESTKKMLTLIEPYVAYGYPDLATIRKLVYARGFVKRRKQRVPLNDNRLVEEQLGRLGLVCVEDLVHQIKTVGPYFSHVNKFLWNFKLHAPRGGWRRIRLHYCEGGDAGNREDLIGKLISRMI